MVYNVLMDNVQAVKENEIDKMKTNETPAWKIFLYVMIGFIGLSALIGIFLIIFSDSDHMEYLGEFLSRIIETTFALELFCFLAMNLAFCCKNRKRLVRVAATAGLIMNIFWLVPWMLYFWGTFDVLKDGCVSPIYSYSASDYARQTAEYDRRYSEYQKCIEPYENVMTIGRKTLATTGALVVLLTIIANYVAFENYTNVIRVLKITAISCGIVLASIFISVLDFDIDDLSQIFWKIVAIVGVVFAFALVVTPILVMVKKKKR